VSERHYDYPPVQCSTRIVVKGLEWQCAMRQGHDVAEKTPGGTATCTIFSRPDYRAETATVRSPPPKRRRKTTKKPTTTPTPATPSVADRVFAQLVAGTLKPGRRTDRKNTHQAPANNFDEEHP